MNRKLKHHHLHTLGVPLIPSYESWNSMDKDHNDRQEIEYMSNHEEDAHKKSY